MKEMKKIVMLVALVVALSLTLSACRLPASQPAAVTPTGGAGEVPFPVESPDSVSQFATQTALASTPLPVLPTETPQVIVATSTEQQQGAEQQPSATTDPNTGGGVAQPAGGPTPVVNRPTSYTLQRGEWPICIARRFDLDLDNFFQANSLNMNSKPAAGTTLTVPASGTWDSKFGQRSLRQHPVDYTVVAGDSVYSIACKFGDVTPEAILAVNNLSNASDVAAGMTIRIP